MGGRREEEVEIGEEEARVTWKALGGANGGYFVGLPLFQVAEKESRERTFLGKRLRPL